MTSSDDNSELSHAPTNLSNPFSIAAIVLDPTVKWQHFDTWDPQWRPDMRSTIKQFWETQYRSSTDLSSYSSATQSPSITKTQNKYYE